MVLFNTRPPTALEWRTFIRFAHKNRKDIEITASAGNPVAQKIIYLMDNRPTKRNQISLWRDAMSYNIALLMVAVWEAVS